jgi:hypothetical protein
VLTNVVNEAGGYPTNNFKTGQFDGASKIRRNPGRDWKTSAAEKDPPPTAATGAV